ncbi:hypothetical protein SGFS_036900 [Streptomyces graminofaciens]|uniref:Uncharacterized protein n=1 Tax=Streptomyces graminofaciens TaxID=68212 RepID=A0ABM7F8Y2_9ACTN|nr:hypothetical protein SGFS_036900 [Streptomyces graminofaciens]
MSTTHCRAENDASRESVIWGRATLTMVTSTRSMKVPRHTASSGIHLRMGVEPLREEWVGIEWDGSRGARGRPGAARGATDVSGRESCGPPAVPDGWCARVGPEGRRESS